MPPTVLERQPSQTAPAATPPAVNTSAADDTATVDAATVDAAVSAEAVTAAPLVTAEPSEALIPPDVAAVLGNARIHPDLLRRASQSPAAPTAAALTRAALRFAAWIDAASLEAVISDKSWRSLLERALVQRADPGRAHPNGKPGHASLRGIVHSVGKCGVLHLGQSDTPRALTVVRGSLEQRCTTRAPLQPGAVRLLPAGHALTLADLAGEGAVAVEVWA